MFILKSLVAALALGLVQDTVAAAAAPACCTNKCGKSVQLAKNGKKDCSAFLIKTVTPTRTTTLSKTTTLARTTTISKKITLTKTTTLPIFYNTITLSTTTTLFGTTTVSSLSTVIEEVTGTTDITVTDVASETDYSASTSLATVEETEVVTDTATATETQVETTTVTYAPPAITLKKRYAQPTKPAYASVCDNRAYTSACSCIGIKPKTTTKPAVVKTVYKTKTAYKTVTKSTTLTAYKTSTAYKTFTTHKTLTVYQTFTVRDIDTTTQTVQAPPQTQTSVVSLTTYTTIISGTAITATETVTRTESVTVTESTVVLATYTAPAAPPVCVGKGFKLRVAGSTSSVNGWWVGYTGSLSTAYPRLFSGGSGALTIDSNGNLQAFSYGGSDFQYGIQNKVNPYPGLVMLKSTKQGINFPWPAITFQCGLGPAPNYQFQCKDTNGVVVPGAWCWDTTVYDWALTLYTSIDQLAGKNCATDGFTAPTCEL
ncbi:hypothetical protein TWF281_010755 [Arthrobotrys megalospora]